ncbi:hypothetical protein EVAR_40052_1 [Eumeta japonica]|uniref:Uncharacterized protein n=1 Tax=Eumeta variegata TaxID=151549 RepID=A0A4C1W8F1_EUMVA|nr:hypothetical protein EVAR_40052_1 [Eumeta japonica]
MEVRWLKLGFELEGLIPTNAELTEVDVNHTFRASGSTLSCRIKCMIGMGMKSKTGSQPKPVLKSEAKDTNWHREKDRDGSEKGIAMRIMIEVVIECMVSLELISAIRDLVIINESFTARAYYSQINSSTETSFQSIHKAM